MGVIDLGERLYHATTPGMVLLVLSDGAVRSSTEIRESMGSARNDSINVAIARLRRGGYIVLEGEPKPRDNDYRITNAGLGQLGDFLKDFGRVAESLGFVKRSS